MKEMTGIDFPHKFDEIQNASMVEPVLITKDDKPHLVLISYEQYKSLRAKAGIQEALHVSELSEADIKAITEAEMPSGYEHLNEELED